MRVIGYIFSYISFSSFIIGVLFKVMHWPGASVMLLVSFPFILITAVLLLIYKLSQEENKSDEKQSKK
jgi:sugar phosphate permease